MAYLYYEEPRHTFADPSYDTESTVEVPRVIELPIPQIDRDRLNRPHLTFSSNAVGGPRLVTFDDNFPPVIYDTAPGLSYGRSRSPYSNREYYPRPRRNGSHSPRRDRLARQRSLDYTGEEYYSSGYSYPYDYDNRRPPQRDFYYDANNYSHLTRVPVTTGEYEPDILYSTAPVPDSVNLHDYSRDRSRY